MVCKIWKTYDDIFYISAHGKFRLSFYCPNFEKLSEFEWETVDMTNGSLDNISHWFRIQHNQRTIEHVGILDLRI